MREILEKLLNDEMLIAEFTEEPNKYPHYSDRTIVKLSFYNEEYKELSDYLTVNIGLSGSPSVINWYSRSFIDFEELIKFLKSEIEVIKGSIEYCEKNSIEYDVYIEEDYLWVLQ